MPKQGELKHLYSPHYRNAIIDTATVALIGDQIGERLAIALTRLDVRTISEKVTIEDNGGLTMLNQTPDHEPVRIVEFTADMRPDQAMSEVDPGFGTSGLIGA